MIVFRPWPSPEPLLATAAPPGWWEPAADVWVAERQIVIVLELAGVPREAIEVTAEGRRLLVRGERPRPAPSPGGQYRQAELVYGPFRRVFEFAFELERADLTARSSDGLLEIRIVSSDDARRQVTIEAGG